MDIVENCCRINFVHQYENNSREDTVIQCEDCIRNGMDSCKRNQLEYQKKVCRNKERREHLEGLVAKKLKHHKLLPLKYLLEKILGALSLSSSNARYYHFRNQIRADPLLMHAFRITKYRSRLCFEYNVLEYSNLYLIFK